MTTILGIRHLTDPKVNTSIESTDNATSALHSTAQKRSVSEQISIVIPKRIKNKNASPAKFQAVRSFSRDTTIYRGTSRNTAAESYLRTRWYHLRNQFLGTISWHKNTKAQPEHTQSKSRLPPRPLPQFPYCPQCKSPRKSQYPLRFLVCRTVQACTMYENPQGILRFMPSHWGFPQNTHRTCLFSYHVRDQQSCFGCALCALVVAST